MRTPETGVVRLGGEDAFGAGITESVMLAGVPGYGLGSVSGSCDARTDDLSEQLFSVDGDELSTNDIMLLAGRLLSGRDLAPEVRRVIDVLRQKLWELQRDVITGCLNQTGFRDRTEAEFSYAKRKGSDLACIFFDIDKFKGLNDGYGHGAGDAVIAKLGEVIRMTVRSYDVVGRDGGDEIVILLRDVDEDYACAMTERICAEVARMEVEYSGKKLPAVTVSCGVAIMSAKDMSFDSLRDRADRALYEAKSNGRNVAYMADFVEGDGGEFGDCEVYAPCQRC